jgi:hypothetical protein
MQIRTMMKVWLVVLLLVGGTLLVACGETAPSKPESTVTPAIDAVALLEDRCASCHGLNRVTNVGYTRAEWQEVVTRMIKHGAVLNAAEEVALVDHLAENYKP